MEKLKTITVADGKKPKIKIVKNPQLTNQKTFVPGNMKCLEDEKSDCFLVEIKEENEPFFKTTIGIIVAVAAVTGSILLVILVIIGIWLIKKKKKTEKSKEDAGGFKAPKSSNGSKTKPATDTCNE